MNTLRFRRYALTAGCLVPLAGFAAAAPAAAEEFIYAASANPATCIDLSSLPPDVLNCNVCRMRLGLPPIAGGGPLDAAGPGGFERGHSSAELVPETLRESQGIDVGEPVSPRDASVDSAEGTQASGPATAPSGPSEAPRQEQQMQMLRRLVQEIARIERENRRETEELRSNVDSLRQQLEQTRKTIAELESRLSKANQAAEDENTQEPTTDTPPASQDADSQNTDNQDADDQASEAPDDASLLPAEPDAPETPAAPAAPESPQPQQESQQRDI